MLLLRRDHSQVERWRQQFFVDHEMPDLADDFFQKIRSPLLYGFQRLVDVWLQGKYYREVSAKVNQRSYRRRLAR